MSLINGQFWGDSSGKIAGVVFGRSKGGKSMRARVKPTDAKTQAQQSVRAAFASAISLWSSLDSIVKRRWNTFAATGFRSKNAKRHNVSSGYQAFASCNFVLKQASDHSWPTEFSPSTVDATFDKLASAVQSPPTTGFSGAIQCSDATPLFLKFSKFDLITVGGAATAEFEFNPAPQATAPIFKNPETDADVSFSFYASAPIPPGRQTVNKHDVYYLGNTGVPGTITGWTSASKFTLKFTVPDEYLQSLKLGFAPDNEVFITAYAISSFGQCARIGMLRVVLT